MMDSDFDFSLAPSQTIYGSRCIKLDTVNQGSCYLGSLNSPCIGISAQQSQQAPGLLGNQSFPMVLADPTSGGNVPIYSYGRRCLVDVDPSFGGQIKPGDFVVSSNSGYATKATPTGPWNQWIIGISTSFANGGQSCNVKVVIFPWSPTGS